MFKNLIRNLGQKLIGFDRYLFIFSLLTVLRIRVFGYEKEFRYFNLMIKDDGAILDIGANIGIMTVMLAKRHPNATIYSFEPVPENARALEKVRKFFGLQNVQIIQTALGDVDEDAKMITPTISNAKMQGLSHIIESSSENGETGDVFPVQVQKLDNITSLQQLEKISAIKIDVENFEYYVLKGGENMLRKHRPLVFCELWNNERRDLCFELMKSMGYSIKIWQQGNLVDYNKQETLNYFFLP